MSKSSLEPTIASPSQLNSSSTSSVMITNKKFKKKFNELKCNQANTADEHNKDNLKMLDNHIKSVNITELNFMIIEKACFTMPGNI